MLLLGLRKAAGLTCSKVGVTVWNRNRGQRRHLAFVLVMPYFTDVSSSLDLSDLLKRLLAGLLACQRELQRYCLLRLLA